MYRNIFTDKNLYLKNLEKFSISHKYGFLEYFTEDIMLRDPFNRYNIVYENIYEILKNGQINQEMSRLSYDEAEFLNIKDFKELTKIFSITSVLTNAYLYNNRHNEYKKLPRQLAGPLYYSSQKLKILPVFCLWASMHSVKSQSYQEHDKEITNSFDDLKMRFSFTNTPTEDYFFKINLLVSIKMQKLFEIIFNLNHLLYKFYDEISHEINFKRLSQSHDFVILIKKELNEILQIIQFMNKSSSELFRIIDADVFYQKLRPYLYGFSAYKNGLFFEGINKTFHFHGASAGQDPYSLLLKATLGINYSHSGSRNLTEYEEVFKEAIRNDHLIFIKIIENFSLIKHLCFIDEFKEVYEEIMKNYKNFYTIHNGFVTKFIEKPAEKINERITGSGGSHLNLVKSLSSLYDKKDSNKEYVKILDKNNSLKITSNLNTLQINVDITINANTIEDLIFLSKLNLEVRLEELMLKEKFNSQFNFKFSHKTENRIMITFSILDLSKNYFSQMLIEGIQSMIDIISAKNVYTNIDVICMVLDKKTPQLLLEEIKHFLLNPAISKVMHSSRIDLHNKDEISSCDPWRNSDVPTYNLITGGNKGIGLAVCKAMAEEGNNLILTGRKLNTKGQDIARWLEEEYKIRAIFLELDISDSNSVRNFITELKNNNVILKSVIHNAGVGTQTSKEQATELCDPNEILIKVNSIGCQELQIELEKSNMLTQGCRIVVMNSVGSIRPFKEFNPTDIASKRILNIFSENLKKNSNISVATIFLGATATDKYRSSTLESLEDKRIAEKFINQLPKRTIIDPLIIGKIVNFFSRPEVASYTNGCRVQASCGLNINYNNLPERSYDVNEEPYKKESQLTLPQVYFQCLMDMYHPQENPDGKINLGTSLNYKMSEHIINFMPKFLEVEDLHYSAFTGSEQIRQLISKNTGYDYKETLPVHTLEASLDLLCHHFKKICIESNINSDANKDFKMSRILNHSKVELVDGKNSECNIFLFPNTQQIKHLITSAEKFTLFVIKDKTQVIHSRNKNVLYAFTESFSKNVHCGVLQTSNVELLEDLVANHMVYYVTSNLIQVAAAKEIHLNAEHDIKSILSKMFSQENQILSCELNLNISNEIAENFIYLTNKTSVALDSVSKSLFTQGDRITIKAPLYPGFLSDFTRNGSILDLIQEENPNMILDSLIKARDSGSAGFVICNPHNPTGKIYGKEEIERICKWAGENSENKKFYLIFDEIYAYSTFSDQNKFHSAINYATKYENVIVIRGFAKDFGLSGLNFGVVVSCNEKIKENFAKWKNILEPMPCVLSVFDEMLRKTDLGRDILVKNQSFLKQAIQITTQLLKEKNIKFLPPDGGLFIMIDIEDFMIKKAYKNDNDVFNKCFKEFGLSIAPGSIFKYKKPGMFRICPIYGDNIIREGIERLNKFLKE